MGCVGGLGVFGRIQIISYSPGFYRSCQQANCLQSLFRNPTNVPLEAAQSSPAIKITVDSCTPAPPPPINSPNIAKVSVLPGKTWKLPENSRFGRPSCPLENMPGWPRFDAVRPYGWCTERFERFQLFGADGSSKERVFSTFSYNQGKKKHININKFAGLSRDWVGAKKLFMCFFRVIPYGREKHTNKVPPQIPGQSRETFVYVFFSLCAFFSLPYIGNGPNTVSGEYGFKHRAQ